MSFINHEIVSNNTIVNMTLNPPCVASEMCCKRGMITYFVHVIQRQELKGFIISCEHMPKK